MSIPPSFEPPPKGQEEFPNLSKEVKDALAGGLTEELTTAPPSAPAMSIVGKFFSLITRPMSALYHLILTASSRFTTSEVDNIRALSQVQRIEEDGKLLMLHVEAIAKSMAQPPILSIPGKIRPKKIVRFAEETTARRYEQKTEVGKFKKTEEVRELLSDTAKQFFRKALEKHLESELKFYDGTQLPSSLDMAEKLQEVVKVAKPNIEALIALYQSDLFKKYVEELNSQGKTERIAEHCTFLEKTNDPTLQAIARDLR